MRFIAVALAIMFALTGLAPGLAHAQYDELILRVAMQDDIRSTNPLVIGDVWSWNVIGYIYDGPVHADPDTEELVPYIAVGSMADAPVNESQIGWGDCDIGEFGFAPESTWGPSSSVGEAVIFYDFEDVLWHDGHQMDIRDVMYSMHVEAQVPEWSSSMNCLKDNGGRSGSNYSETGWLNVFKVWESEDHLQAALRFVLTEPFNDFFGGTLSTFLLPYHVWGSTVSGQNVDEALIWCDEGYDQGADSSWKVDNAQAYENPVPVGSGPFKWDHWDQGQLLKINTWRDHFFKPGFKYEDYCLDDEGNSLTWQPQIDAIVYKIYKTAEAAFLALKNDDIDYIAWSLPPTFVQELENLPELGVNQYPETGFFYMGYNMRRQSFGYNESATFPYAPEDDFGKPLRRAIAHCIDKDRIVARLLLNYGVAGTGPVSPLSEWYNDSVPTYDFDPEEAKQILADAGYVVLKDGQYLSGDAAVAAAGPGNWWYNPDRSPIGSGPGGLIEIPSPEANYDPIHAQGGLMVSQQLQDIGLYAESVVLDFPSLVDRADERDFDMYILGWRIGSKPDDYLHAFFHSSQTPLGQNYPGYQNTSYDELIDLARSTGDPEVKRQAILDAQASISYDLPYDVLYYRTNIEVYRADRFVGWVVGDSGSIFNWESILNIRATSPYKVRARFVSPPSALASNSTGNVITVTIVDRDGNPLEGAYVKLEAMLGTLSVTEGYTATNGRFMTIYSAPYVGQDAPDGRMDIIRVAEATYADEGGWEYDPAPPILTSIMIYPEGQRFLSVSLYIDPDIIDPDVDLDFVPGIAYVYVTVTDEGGLPVFEANVSIQVSPDILGVSASYGPTDEMGVARFIITAIDLYNDDNSISAFQITAAATSPNADVNPGSNHALLEIVDAYYIPDRYLPGPESDPWALYLLAFGLPALLGVATVALLILEYKSKKKRL